jgi:CheY-like chemotaxis protein
MSEPTLLFVDDRPELADGYAERFDEYDTRVAYGGHAGLEKLDDEVDIVFLDRRMPDLPGEEVLESVLESAYDPRVVMLTGVEPDVDIVEMGFDAYLEKPVDPEALHEVVDEFTGTPLDAFDDPALRALGDPKTSRTCAALLDEARSAQELAEVTGEALPTVYRRLNTLKQASLIDAETTVSPDGNHYQEFVAAPSRLVVEIDGSVEIRAERIESGDVSPEDDPDAAGEPGTMDEPETADAAGEPGTTDEPETADASSEPDPDGSTPADEPEPTKAIRAVSGSRSSGDP